MTRQLIVTFQELARERMDLGAIGLATVRRGIAAAWRLGPVRYYATAASVRFADGPGHVITIRRRRATA